MIKKIQPCFAYSRTILIARLYSLMGILVMFHDFALPYIVSVDWAPFTQKIPAYLWPLIIMGSGMLFEYMRRITKEDLATKKKEKEAE